MSHRVKKSVTSNNNLLINYESLKIYNLINRLTFLLNTNNPIYIILNEITFKSINCIPQQF